MPGEIDRTLVNFLRAVRGADVRVSVAETLDAVEVARFVGWENRVFETGAWARSCQNC